MKNKSKNIEEVLKKGAKEARKAVEFPPFLHAKIMYAIEKESAKPAILRVFGLKLAVSAVAACFIIIGLIFYPKFINMDKPTPPVPNAVILALESQSYIINLEENSALEESLKGVIIDMESNKSKDL